MNLAKHIKRVYFIGIGGIGMSALARYCHESGLVVAGYDKTGTRLTEAMKREGIRISYAMDTDKLDTEADLVIYTPAIGENNPLLLWYRSNGTEMLKRAEFLQILTKDLRTIAVAGTHGKTTISSMLAHILRDSGFGTTAFLGGIVNNYATNFWSSTNGWVVVEADEYDRSFLKLNPYIAVISAMDPDHLDVYGNTESMEKAFIAFTENIKSDGLLWYKHGMKSASALNPPEARTYSLQNNAADVYASGIQIEEGGYRFDVVGEDWMLEHVHLQLGGMHNVENAVIAIAIARHLEIEDELIRSAIAGFKGVKRRFDYVIKNPDCVYIDDYAHHPEELMSLINSVRVLFPGKKCVVVFQPHLYSRTRDFAEAFAKALDEADEVLLMDIYPAREELIPGVTVQLIKEAMGNPNCTILNREGVLEYVKHARPQLLVTAGAGDISELVRPIKTTLLNGQKN